MSSQFLPASRPGYHPRNRRSLALGVGAATLVAAHVHAQAPQGQRDPSYVHESWTVKDGLPVNSINAILQDRTGYIWIATFDGLVRFDGIRFTVFNSVRSAELPSNRIVQLHEGRDGTLWVATRDTWFDFATDSSRISRSRTGQSALACRTCWSTPPAPSGLETRMGCGGHKAIGWCRSRVKSLGVRSPVFWHVATGISGSGAHRAGIFRVGRDGGVMRVPADRAIDSDSIVTMFEDGRGALWVAGSQRFWEWRDRPVEVTAGGRSLHVLRIVNVAAGSVFAQALTGSFRIEWRSGDAHRSTGPRDREGDHRSVERRPADLDRSGQWCVPQRAPGLHPSGRRGPDGCTVRSRGELVVRRARERSPSSEAGAVYRVQRSGRARRAQRLPDVRGSCRRRVGRVLGDGPASLASIQRGPHHAVPRVAAGACWLRVPGPGRTASGWEAAACMRAELHGDRRVAPRDPPICAIARCSRCTATRTVVSG